MATNNNAYDYASERVDVFFEVIPYSLTGQCVSLVKHYLGNMCRIADWQAARGHAKDYGDTLVRQGHAHVVPSSRRGRGDLVVWKEDGGGYGHIGVLVGVDEVFEANVGLAGTRSKNVEGNIVYASRIDPLTASWRKGNPIYYRMRGYKEVTNTDGSPSRGNMADKLNKTAWQQLAHGILGRNGLSGRTNALDGSSDATAYIGRELTLDLINELFISEEARQWRDSQEYGSVPNINYRLDSVAALAKENTRLKEEVERLTAQSVQPEEVNPEEVKPEAKPVAVEAGGLDEELRTDIKAIKDTLERVFK